VSCPACFESRGSPCRELAPTYRPNDERPTGHVIAGSDGLCCPARDRAAAVALGDVYPARCPALDVRDVAGQAFLGEAFARAPVVGMGKTRKARYADRPPAPSLFG
jgi:hypothetical protein